MFFPKQANETKKILEGYGVKKKEKEKGKIPLKR